MKVYEQKSRSTSLTTSQEPFPWPPLNGCSNTDCHTPTGKTQSFGQKQTPALFLKSEHPQTSILDDTLNVLVPIEVYDQKEDAYYTIHVPQSELQENGTATEMPTRQPTSMELQKQADVLSSLKTLFQLTKYHK